MTSTPGPIGPTPKSQVWRVVVIEDNPDDRVEIRRLLLQGSERRYKFVEAETGAEGTRSVLDPTDGPPDCVVLDYSLPDTNAVEVLAALIGPDGLTVCPVVVLTGSTNHEQTRAVLRAGAQDYLGKGWMTAESLTRAVENAAERFAMTRELSARATSLRMSEERFRLAARVAGLAVAEIDYATNQVHLSPESAALFGLPSQPSVVSRATIHSMFHPDDRAGLEKLIATSHDPAGTGEFAMDHRIIQPDGQVRWHSVRKQVFFEQTRPARALLAMFDITDRKHAEEASQQNALLFAKIIEQAPGGVYVMDAQLRVREVNAEAQPIFANVRPLIGRELGEVLEILWGPEIGRQYTDIVRHTLETGERRVSSISDHLRHDISEEQAYEWEMQRITLPDGQHGVVCYFQNVTKRERAAAALRKSEHFLKQIAEITPGVLHVFDLHEQRSVFINRTVASIIGYSPEEVAGMGREVASTLMHPADQSHFASHLERLRTLRDDESAQFEHRMRAKSGEWRWFQSRDAVFARDSAGAVQQIIGSAFDITERKLQETVLRASELRYRRLFESAKDGILILDAHAATITDANPFISELLGYSSQELLGKELWQIGLFEDVQASKAAMQQLQEKGYIRYEDLPLETKAGRRISVEFVSNVYGEEGDTVIQCNIRDISERKRLEESLKVHAADLSELDRRKDEFLATLAHELRNPLAPMRNAVELLRIKCPAIPELQWARDVIDRQTQAMTRLIDDLMDISRINQGKVKLQREQVELARIVQGAVETSQPLIEQMGHELTVTLPPRTVIVDADLTRLAQVILNLLNNAAKYTERGGRIDLRAELQGSDVVLSVTDTGIGIPVDKLPTLFEMFSQVEGALSRSQGGLGIGLCLVKRLVEMHGGSVEARSGGSGQGSEFMVRLPIVVEQTDSSQANDGGDQAAPTSDLRILVVDDNRDAAECLAMLLTAMGNNVQTAHDGEEAVAAAGTFRPHVVLCDIGLPKLNGYEACRQMKARAWDEEMVLIAVTGWGQDDDRRKSEEAGFDHHMVKPVDSKALMRLLAGLGER
jgi:PAS domain S-box-containing protein